MENNMEGIVDDIKERFVRAELQKSKDPTQEEGSQDQAMNDGQDVGLPVSGTSSNLTNTQVGSPVSGISSNPTTGTSSMATNTNTVSPNTSQQETLASMSTNVAGTGTKTSASSSTGQEKNKTSTTTSVQEEGSQDKAQNDGQDVGSPVSGNSSNPTNSQVGSLASPNTSQQETNVAGIGTKTDASSSLGQEQKKTSTETPSAGTKIDTSSSAGQKQNKTSTATSSSGTSANDNASSSRTSEEQRQIPESSQEIVEEPPELGTCVGTSGSYTLIDTLQETEIIRSMAVDINDVLFTGSDRMIRKWHRGQQVSIFPSFKGTCYAIAAKYMQYPEPCVFVAHDHSEVTVWASSQIDNLLTPRWTLYRLWDLYFPWSDPGRYPISCLCLSDDFNFIYAGSTECTLNTWHARKYDGSPINTIFAHTRAINALAVGLSVVFTGSTDGTIKMWRRETYVRNESQNDVEVRHLSIATFYAQGAVPWAVYAVVFCTVDNVHGCLYAGSSDGNVRCWKNLSVNEPDAGNWELEVMSDHNSAVTCLAWCSGPFVFSGSRDKTIRVWRRAENHSVALVLEGHTDGITCIAAQNDWEVHNAAGPLKWIVYSGSLDRTLRIWRVYEQPGAITGGQEVA